MKKTILLFVAFFAPLFALHGQEKIEQLYAMYGEHSIIRELVNGKWIVYSGTGEPSFSLVVDGVTNVNFIFLPETIKSVSDFEIYGDSVYFCGMLRSGVPVMGPFNISQLIAPPSIPGVDYAKITGVDTLIALEIMEIAGGRDKHIVMIGKQEGMGILVDVLPSPSGWNTYYILLLTDKNTYTIHDDLAITDSHVVVTSYSQKYKLDTEIDTAVNLADGFIWFVKKPIVPGVPLSASNPKFINIPSIKMCSPFLVADCEGAACVAATAAYLFDGVTYIPGINIYGFDNTTNVMNVRLEGVSNLDTLRDICYDSLSRTTELLIQRKTSIAYESIIYTLEQTSPLGGVAQGHKYQNYMLNSLINQSQNINQFIGSGIDIYNLSHLYLFRYNNTASAQCTGRISAIVRLQDCDEVILGSLSYYRDYHNEMSSETRPKRTFLENNCEQVK